MPRSLRTLLVATAVLASLAGAAEAVTLATAPLRISPSRVNPSRFDCIIANGGRSPVTVVITARLGDQIRTQGPQVLQPGEVDHLGSLNETIESTLGRCTFDVKGSTGDVRASACVADDRHICKGLVPAY